MVTKADYGLGPLYHGTSKDSADAILVGGLLVMGGQPIWLSFSQQEALENAQEKEGSPVVLEINLPDDWLLERAEAGTYLSWRDIPSEYIRRLDMAVAFTLYKGFLIVEYSETDVKAYRSRQYYAGNIASYEAASQAPLSQVIDEAEDQGDFTDVEYYELMRELGRAEPGRYEAIDEEKIKEIARYMQAHPESVARAMWNSGLIVEAEQEGLAKALKSITTDWLSTHA